MPRPLMFLIAAGFALVISATSTLAAELIMFRLPGCPWCDLWDREVKPIYPKTEIGKLAPVRFVDLRQTTTSGVSLVRPVRFSPTFVIAIAGREIGRIEGYPGDAFFWGLLERYKPQLIEAKQDEPNG